MSPAIAVLLIGAVILSNLLIGLGYPGFKHKLLAGEWPCVGCRWFGEECGKQVQYLVILKLDYCSGK